MNPRSEIPALMKLNFFGHFLMTANKAMVMNSLEREWEYSEVSIKKKIDYYWAYCMLPVVFPMEWKMHNYQPIHYEAEASLHYCVMNYFNLTMQEFEHLFTVRQQRTNIYGGVILDYNAEPWELGANIMWFIKWKMKNN